ncbi:MAG TPA: threonine--tRNA ligase [Clostridiales bacterium]|nr:threonine--tRNA ligase [Clostridiales bacterium]
MITVKLKDGTAKEIEKEISVLEFSKMISEGLAKAATCAELNGEKKDLRYIIKEDCNLNILTFDNSLDGKKAYWHTASHIMAQAIKRLFPNTKLAIGPATNEGFYYDFDIDKPFTDEDKIKIEEEMKKIIKEDLKIERFELSREDAIKLMEEKKEIYKIELINDLPEDSIISFYKQGEFVDLCCGPHLQSTGKIKAIKILSSSSAYWRGNEKNKMLQRIYGIAFPKKSQLEEYINILEEAKKRDHNKLGRELELFTTVDYIGQGLPIMLPKGAKVLQILQRMVEDEEEKRGYLLTKTPYLAKSDLYKKSGHWDHYKDSMFIIGDENKEKDVFALRPMTCPFQFQAYLNRQRSYRDLPLRYNETSTLFRNEDSGEMHGLIRVRQFTISEGHLLVRLDQLEEEVKGCIDLINLFSERLGLSEGLSYRFSKWDPNNREKYMGTDEQWEHSQAVLKGILDDLKIEYTEEEGEAAFYGPKLDIQYKNVFGKEDTIITVQVDFQLAEKFDMTYIDEKGNKVRPVVIHRTSLGCYERTLAMIIERFAGAFPTWLAPVQVKILSIAKNHIEYANKVKTELERYGIRVELDEREEKIGYKIREAQLQKIPYMLIVGEKEMKTNTVGVRSRKDGDIGAKKIEDFLNQIIEEIREYRK